MADKHLPGLEKDEETLGKALYLENRYWQAMEMCVARGIVKAFKGK